MTLSSKTAAALCGLLLSLCATAQVVDCSSSSSSSSAAAACGNAANQVPEPSSLPLVLIAVAGVVGVVRYLRRKT